MASLSSIPANPPSKSTSVPTSTHSIFVPNVKLAGIEQAPVRLLSSVKGSPVLRVMASRESQGVTKELSTNFDNIPETDNDPHVFTDMKQRFLSFKKKKCLENLEHYQSLGKAQAPKFMVVACGDSRVCPSQVLGFEPGEAFVIRNVGNLVPPYEKGPTETNAALEFAVNALEVENILVMGHSCCGGIRALMSMQDDEGESSSFIKSWVINANNARLSTKSAASDLDFDQQCRHCEKESINRSLVSLLSYPWIEKRVKKGELFIHGGYYDFIDCTFEKWTLDYKGSMLKEKTGAYSIKDREFWC